MLSRCGAKGARDFWVSPSVLVRVRQVLAENFLRRAGEFPPYAASANNGQLDGLEQLVYKLAVRQDGRDVAQVGK